MSRRFVVLSISLLLAAAGFFAATVSIMPTAAQESCSYKVDGPIEFDQAGYPRPQRDNPRFVVPEGDMAVVELVTPVDWPHSNWPKHVFVPAKSSESGNRRFEIYNPWHEYQWYALHRYSGCTYQQVLDQTAVEAAKVDPDVDVRWTLMWERIGLVQPEVVGDPLPFAPSDPLWQCQPDDGNGWNWKGWETVEVDHFIPKERWLDLRWEVTYDGTAAYGTYPGVTVVGPARLQKFIGECDEARWWEPFAFARLVKEARNPTGKAGVEFNPHLFVSDGRVFLPNVIGSGGEPVPEPTLRPIQ